MVIIIFMIKRPYFSNMPRTYGDGTEIELCLLPNILHMYKCFIATFDHGINHAHNNDVK
jgi:hypothetical protein